MFHIKSSVSFCWSTGKKMLGYGQNYVKKSRFVISMCVMLRGFCVDDDHLLALTTKLHRISRNKRITFFSDCKVLKVTNVWHNIKHNTLLRKREVFKGDRQTKTVSWWWALLRALFGLLTKEKYACVCHLSLYIFNFFSWGENLALWEIRSVLL